MPNSGAPAGPVAGWSSPVARQAHNLKVVGSNPAPATNFGQHAPRPFGQRGFFCFVPWPNAIRFAGCHIGKKTAVSALQSCNHRGFNRVDTKQAIDPDDAGIGGRKGLESSPNAVMIGKIQRLETLLLRQ